MEHHHDYEHDFLTADQVVPLHHQHVHAAPQNRDFYECHSEPRASEILDKLDTHNPGAEEEIHEHGEVTRWTTKSDSIQEPLVVDLGSSTKTRVNETGPE